MKTTETTREDRAAIEALAAVLLAERRGAPMSPKLNDIVRPLAELYRDDHGDATVPVTYFDPDARELLDTGSPEMLREAAEFHGGLPSRLWLRHTRRDQVTHAPVDVVSQLAVQVALEPPAPEPVQDPRHVSRPRQRPIGPLPSVEPSFPSRL